MKDNCKTANLVKLKFSSFDFKKDEDGAFENFLQDLEEKGFKQLIGASDKPEDEDEKVYPRHVQDLIEKDGKTTEKLQKEVIDLFIFYLTKLPHVPEKYFDDLESAHKRALEIIEDCCIFKDLKDLEFLRSMFKTLQEFISEPDFPQKDEIVYVTRKAVKECLNVLKRDKPLDAYDMTLQLWKAVAISPNVDKFLDLIMTFDELTSHLKEQHIKKEPKLFETWAPVALEVLEKGLPLVKTGKIMRSMIYDFRDYAKPQKSYDKLWIPILVNCVKWQIPVTMEAACRVIRDDQWVRCLNWKENTKAAQEILQTLIDMDFDKISETNELKEIADVGGDIVNYLMEKLKICKAHKSCEVLVTELCMKLLEKYDLVEELYKLTDEAATKVSLKYNKDLIGQYLDRFMALLKDEDVPWDNTSQSYLSSVFISYLVDSIYYEDKQFNDSEVDQKMIDMILYSMEEDRELCDWSNGQLTVFGIIATEILTKFVSAKRDSNTLSKLKPLIPSIQRLMSNHEDERVTEQCGDILVMIGQQASQVLDSDHIGNLIDHYIENPDVHIMVNLEAAYENGPEEFAKRFSDLVEVFVKDNQTNCFVMQCLLLKKIAETQPEVFTPHTMKLFFDVHFMDFTANSQVLIFMDILSKSQPALFGPFIPHPLLNPKLMLDTMASYQMNIVTRAAAVCKDCQKPVFDYFIERLKSSTDQHVLYACIMGLREMLEICGPDFFTEEVKAEIEKQKTNAPAKYVKDVAQDLQDELAGRSLEKVSKDVDTHKEQIEKVEIGVAGTKVVLKKVHRDVKQQGKEIDGIKTDLVEVNERVDIVEGDLEDTNLRVDEVDKKCGINSSGGELAAKKDVAELQEIYKNQDISACFALLQLNMEEQITSVKRDVQSLSERLEKLENSVQVLNENLSVAPVNETNVFRTDEEIQGDE